MSERSPEERDREFIELLTELRVALPGVQVLFAFLLIVPFSNGWKNVSELQEDVYYAGFLCAALASILLIAPSVNHRIRWRHGEKERLLIAANRSAIAGTVFLAAGMTATVFLITDVLFSNPWAALGSAAVGGRLRVVLVRPPPLASASLVSAASAAAEESEERHDCGHDDDQPQQAVDRDASGDRRDHENQDQKPEQ